MITKSIYFSTLLIFLWSVIMFHEIIPHYHPEGNTQKVKILLDNTHNNNTNNSNEKSDEDGILDNILVILYKQRILISPSFVFVTISPFIVKLVIPYSISSIKYFKTKSPPIKLISGRLRLLRAPPFS